MSSATPNSTDAMEQPQHKGREPIIVSGIPRTEPWPIPKPREPQVATITPNIYLSDIFDAQDEKVLDDYMITHVFSVGEIPKRHGERTYKYMKILDLEVADISNVLAEGTLWMEEAVKMGGNVLVHCWAGRSRSVSVVVAYLIKVNKMGLAEAMEFVMEKRPTALPNDGFMMQLKEWEESCQKAEAKGAQLAEVNGE